VKYKDDLIDFFEGELHRLGIPIQHDPSRFVDLSEAVNSVNSKFNAGAYRFTRRDAQRVYDELSGHKDAGCC
jgi:hypothetical protein